MDIRRHHIRRHRFAGRLKNLPLKLNRKDVIRIQAFALAVVMILLIAIGGRSLDAYISLQKNAPIIVATYNIGAANDRLVQQRRLIHDGDVSILGVQEAIAAAQGGNADCLFALSTDKLRYRLFSKAVSLGDGREYGVGILSRYEIDQPETILLESGRYEQRVLSHAVVKVRGREISFYTTHLSFEDDELRRTQLQQIAATLKADPCMYKFLTGDFNLDAPNELDLFKKDFFIINNPQNAFETVRTTGGAPKSLCVDNILVSKNVIVLNSGITDSNLSDHNLFFAEILFLH